MPGKGSRARRVEASRRARADVYASNGDVYTTQPFTCERQARIYEAAYNKWRQHYWRMERLHEELAEVYGYSKHMRSNTELRRRAHGDVE